MPDYVTPLPGTPMASQLGASGPAARDVVQPLAASQKMQLTTAGIVGYGIVGMGIGALDTIGQSFGVIGEQDMQQTLDAVAPGGLGDFYKNNQEGLRIGGELVTLPIPGMIGLKGLKTAQWAMSAGKSGGVLRQFGQTLLGSSARLHATEQNLIAEAVKVKEATGTFAGRTFDNPAIRAAKKSFNAARVANTAREAAAFELAYRAFYNKSELLEPAEYNLNDELMWAGAGVALGAGIGFVQARYAARALIKAAPELSPTAAASLRELKTFANKDIGNVTALPQQRGPLVSFFARTKELTNGAIVDAASPELKTNLATDLASFDKIIKENLTDMGRDTHPFVNSFQMTDEQAALGVAALDKNPLTFLFSPKIGEITESSTQFYNNITEELDRLKKFGLKLESRIARTMTKSRFQRTADKKLLIRTEAQARLDKLKEEYDVLEKFSTQHHFVIESTGDITPYRLRADNYLDTNDWNAFSKTKWKQTEADISAPGRTTNVEHSRLSTGGKGTLTLDDRFIVENGDDLSPSGWSQLYAMGSRTIGEWKKVPNQVFPVTDEMPRFQLEATLTLGQQNKEAASLIKLGGKFQSLKDVEFHIVNDKYKEWLKALPRTERKTRGARDSLANRSALSPEELIDSLNLPRSDGIRPNAIVELFTNARAQGAKSLDSIFKKSTNLDPNASHPLDLLQAQLRQTVGVTDPTVTMPISGNMLVQKNVRPLLVVSDAIPQLGVADALIQARVLEVQKLALQRLGEIKTPIVAGVLQHVASASAITQAKDVTSLHDAVASGRGVLVPQDRINEQYEAIKAVSLMAQDSDNFVLSNVRKLFDAKLSSQYAAIRHKNNYTHQVDATRVEQSYRHGWAIDRVEFDADGKSARFVLDEDARETNQKLWQRHFKADLPKGTNNYMPDMSSAARKAGAVPLRVTKQAAEFMDEVSRLSIGAGAEDNALRVARGRGAVKLRKWHLPAPELSMENAWFVRDEVGDVVDLYYLGTEAQNKARALAASEKLGASNAGSKYIANSYESTRLQHQWADDPLSFINYSDQWLKTGAAIEGGAARVEIDRTSNTIDKMVNTLAQQYVNVGTRARAAVFEPQIRFAREASQYVGKPSGLAVGENNIFDRYLAQLYSRTTQSGSGFVSRGYKLFENAYDASLTYLYGVKSELSSSSAEGAAAARGLKRLVQENVSDAEFKQYKKLESWSPFDTTAEWLESTHKEIDTSFARRHAVALSKASATMSLRFLDVGTPLLNYSSLMTNIYPIIRAMRPRAGQSHEQWLSDNAAWGSKLSSKNVMTFSPMRAMVSSISNFWTGKHIKDLEIAAAEGMFDPEWLRLEQALVVPHRGVKGGFERFVDAASTLADRSEIHSRRIAWGIGFDLAKDVFKMDDRRNASIFATHFMNNMIGNYNPRNKPGMYQGALGLPLGAFMTYMFNYYKRMFGYLEKGEWSTLAAQYAVQSSVFGAQSVPGWSLFNHYMFSDYDGSDNLATRLDRKLSPGVAELVLHGSLSGIPKIFGVDAPAFYPRGSVDMTQLPATPADWQRAPPVTFLKSIWDGSVATLGNVVGGFNVQQQEEILANYSTNRPFRSIMELASGAKVDRAGQMVDASVRDFASIAAALVGTVPTSARRAQDAYNAQQLVEVNQANARSTLNDHMRAMMRSGNFGTSDIQDVMFRYVKSGGNPAYFGTWLRNNIEASFFPKGERKLLELSRGSDWIELQNLMSAMQFEPGAPPL